METSLPPNASCKSVSLTAASRSDLLSSTMTFWSRIISIICLSFSSSGRDESTTYRIKSASFAYCIARSTPIFSTTSSVLRIPAVSMIFKLIPFNRMDSSSTSRVVPAISVTIARSSPTNRFNRDDFPAFGFPTMTVRMPSLRKSPSSADAISFPISPKSSCVILPSFSG